MTSPARALLPSTLCAALVLGTPVAAVVGAATAALGATAAMRATGGTAPVFAAVVEGSAQDHLVVGHIGGPGRTILSRAGHGSLGPLAVAPSGRQIALVDRSEADEQLAVVDSDGSHFRALTNATGMHYERVIWSADGRTLYFARSRANGSSNGSIGLVPVDGSEPASALSGGAAAWPSAARRGGQWLALDSFRRTARYGRCALIRTDGSHRHDVGPDNCQQPIWQPGKPVLATDHIVNDTLHGVTSQIWLLSINTGRYRAMPQTQSASTFGRVYPLGWSSDGTFLYYEHFRGTSDSLHVFRIRADGSGKNDVTPSIPTQRTIAFAVQRA